MEQPKKPGAPAAPAPRDLADLKARLGLNKGAAPAAVPPAGAPAARGPAPAPFPAPTQAPYPGQAPGPMQGVPAPMQGVPAPMQSMQPGYAQPGYGAAPAAAPQPAAHDPFAAMRPPPGKQFDLSLTKDDGGPTENVRSKGGVAMIVVGVIAVIVGGGLGAGFGIGVSGRRAYNLTNSAAKRVKVEIDEMHKTATQVGTAVALSQQRMGLEKKDTGGFDAKLIEDLEKVKLDPRPDTSKMFKVDYSRLEDAAVDAIMNYYYDSIALYGEVERHVKRSKADRASLESAGAKQTEKGAANYGMIFTGGSGKLLMGNLVEVGAPVCRGGNADCGADALEAFQIRANSGAPWVPRKIGSKPETGMVVPLERTPLMDAALAGSPEQARQEQYKIRLNNIRMLLTRIAANQKQIKEMIEKASARPDLFTL